MLLDDLISDSVYRFSISCKQEYFRWLSPVRHLDPILVVHQSNRHVLVRHVHTFRPQLICQQIVELSIANAANDVSELMTNDVPATTVPTDSVPIAVLELVPQFVNLYTHVALGVQAAALETVTVPDDNVA